MAKWTKKKKKGQKQTFVKINNKKSPKMTNWVYVNKTIPEQKHTQNRPKKPNKYMTKISQSNTKKKKMKNLQEVN